MVVVVVGGIVEGVGCVIFFISGQDMVRIEFVAYDGGVSGGIVEFISALIRKYPVRIAFIAPALVVGRGVRDIVITRREMVRIVVAVGLEIGGIRGIRGIVW